MYWWNVSKLAEDLREQRVDETERFKYFLVISILSSGGLYALAHYLDPVSIVDLAFAGLSVAITVIGTILCYKGNRSGDNIDFIGRVICLSLPISVRLLAVVLVITVLVTLPMGVASVLVGRPVGDLGWDVIGDLVGMVLEICYYWLVYRYLTRIAGSVA